MESIHFIHRYYSCLSVEECNPISTPTDQKSETSDITPQPRLLPLRSWEKRLPERYTVAATPGPNFLRLQVELE